MNSYLDPDRTYEMLEALGVDVISEVGDELVALCPMHKERTGKTDHNPSWSLNKETGAHLCFSCGYKGNAITLVVDLLDMVSRLGIPQYEDAKEWLSNFELDISTRVRKAEREYQKPSSGPIPMTEARMLYYTEPPQWALDARHLTAESAEHYGVRWDERSQAWIAPLRNAADRKLVGFQMKGQGNRLFRNRPTGLKKSLLLFGLDAFEGGRMIVVESPLDCLRLRSAGFEGAVSTCGARVSAEQIILIALHADELVMALDHDETGLKALEEFARTVRKHGIDFKQFAYGDSGAKDPGDMTDEQIAYGMKHAVHSIYGIERMKKA